MGSISDHHLVHRLLAVIPVFAALLATLGVAFTTGVYASPGILDNQPLTIATVGLASLSLVLLHFAALLLVLTRSAQAESRGRDAARRLAAQGEHLRLVSALSALLARESCPRSIAVRAMDFLIEHFSLSSVVYWKPDASGAPVVPDLARSSSSPARASVVLSQPQRLVLATSAARRARALVTDRTGEPRPLDDSRPQGPFGIFLPLPGDEVCEGVLELLGDSSCTDPARWLSLPVLAQHLGLALQRGRHYEHIRERADEDYLTGLYNYGYMQTYLEESLIKAAASGSGVALLFLDVDNFKAFNDHLGHGAGDRVLRTVAHQLRLMTDRVGVVGRSGGDEFMIVLPGHRRGDAEAFIQALQDWLSTGAPGINGVFRIRLSCGFAVFPEDAANRHELLATADARLYRSKQQHALRQPGQTTARPGAVRGGSSRAQPGVGPPPAPSLLPAPRQQVPVELGTFGLLDRILHSVHSKDQYSRLHCERAAEYALVLADHLGVSPAGTRTLRLAALLHDVGRIGVPDHILQKRGPLTEHEFGVIKHQLNVAEQLIVDIPNAEEVRRLVLFHHERWDGSGYPSGLGREDIPYLARILAVADAFAAMTLDRPYKRGLSQREALIELKRAAGTQLDPALVQAFSEALTDGPPRPSADGPALVLSEVEGPI